MNPKITVENIQDFRYGLKKQDYQILSLRDKFESIRETSRCIKKNNDILNLEQKNQNSNDISILFIKSMMKIFLVNNGFNIFVF